MNAAPLFAVDIGNSLTKLAWFDSRAPLPSGPLAPRAEFISRSEMTTLPQPTRLGELPTGCTPPDEVLASLPDATHRWRVSSVNRAGERVLTEWRQSRRPQDDFIVLAHTDLPLRVRVDHPERVGLDRLAAAVAANVLREANRAAIVVQAGTAVTVNLIDADGAFAGGAIVAGFRMQAEALFGAADLLPLTLLEPHGEPPAVVGKNTEDAIRSGLFWGAVGAVRELVARIGESQSRPPQVFVTGGDLARLAPLVGGDTQFVPDMVLAGVALASSDR
jgi:type III pantothenate kinase